MAINKVDLGNETLIDLTNDTVTEDDVLSGVSFHSADGVTRTGKVVVADVIDNLNSTSSTDALSAKQGKVLNDTFDDVVFLSDDSETVVVEPEFSFVEWTQIKTSDKGEKIAEIDIDGTVTNIYGNNGKYKVLTKAEYNALSEEEQKNGTDYYVETTDNQYNAQNIVYNETTNQSVKGAIDNLNDTMQKKTWTLVYSASTVDLNGFTIQDLSNYTEICVSYQTMKGQPWFTKIVPLDAFQVGRVFDFNTITESTSYYIIYRLKRTSTNVFTPETFAKLGYTPINLEIRVR